MRVISNRRRPTETVNIGDPLNHSSALQAVTLKLYAWRYDGAVAAAGITVTYHKWSATP